MAEEEHGSEGTGEREEAAVPEALAEVRSWAGFKLDGLEGRSAGRIEGVLVDASSGEPVWLVVKTGRLRGHSAVPAELAAGGIGRVWIPYPRDAIRSAPEVDPAVGLDPETELRLCDHFGLPDDSDRRSELKDREGEELTAVPDRES